jgi:hypothetical protein
MLTAFQRSPLFGSHEPLEDDDDRDDPAQSQGTCPRHWMKCEREPDFPYQSCEGAPYFTYMSPTQELLKKVWGSIPPPPNLPPAYTTPATVSYHKFLGINFEHLLPEDSWK